MQDLIIRRAVPEDAEALLSIYSHYVKNTAITFEWEVPSKEEFSRRITNTLKKYPYFVAETGGKIAGYAYASAFKERAAYNWAVETSIYVDKDYRNNGIGRVLLEKLEDTLCKMNIINVNACIACTEVEDQYLTNGSVKFHEKMGYRLVGTFNQCGYKFKNWYNMVWMEKMLGAHKKEQEAVIPFPLLKQD